MDHKVFKSCADFLKINIFLWSANATKRLPNESVMCVQGAGAVELVPWPHADQAHEWAQSIQSDFSLPIQVAWTRLSDVSNLHYHTEVQDHFSLMYVCDVSVTIQRYSIISCVCGLGCHCDSMPECSRVVIVSADIVQAGNMANIGCC